MQPLEPALGCDSPMNLLEACAAEDRPARKLPWDLVVPAAALSLIVFFCFLWPLLGSVADPIGANVLEAGRPFLSEGHFLGTDLNGNDVWARLLYGGRASLRIALAVNTVGLLLGGGLAAFGAHVGGLADAVVMRVCDVLMAFPSLVLVVAISHAAGPSESSTIFALTVFSVPAFARVARSATLRVREQPFMAAATLSGMSTWQALLQHVAPNILAQLVTFALLGVGISIILEGALSYLGLGVPAPLPSWGNMISHGQQAALTTPRLLILPCAFLFVTVLTVNLLGEALRARWSKL